MDFESQNIEQLKPKTEQRIEVKEEDETFLKEEFKKECREAAETGYWSRPLFIAARMSEMGIKPEIDDKVWQEFKWTVEYKRRKNDGWGMSFQARYLYEVDPEKMQEEVKLTDEDKRIMLEELENRRSKAVSSEAEGKPGKWGEFLPMLDHIKKIAPDVFAKIEFDEKTLNGISLDLRKRLESKDLRNFVHLAYCLESVSPGSLAKIGFRRQELNEALTELNESSERHKEEGDKDGAWEYAFKKSQILGLQRALRQKEEAPTINF